MTTTNRWLKPTEVSHPGLYLVRRTDDDPVVTVNRHQSAEPLDCVLIRANGSPGDGVALWSRYDLQPLSQMDGEVRFFGPIPTDLG